MMLSCKPLTRSIVVGCVKAMPRVGNMRMMASAQVIEVSGSKLNEAMKPGNKVLYFTATWCPPCRAIKPVYEKLSGEYSSIQFLKIDIDENQDASVEYKITSVPTFVFLNESNQPVAQFSGSNEAALRSNLEEMSKKK